MKNEITWNGMRITLDYQPQPDNYGESVAWYSEGHDAKAQKKDPPRGRISGRKRTGCGGHNYYSINSMVVIGFNKF